MLNTKVKQIEMDTIQQEPFFTELTAEAAAVVEGSGSFGSDIRFDWSLPTRSFRVRAGGTIALASNTTSSPNNRYFSARVTNVYTGNSTRAKLVRVGQGIMTTWTKMKAGTYRINLTDTRDGIYVSGRIGVGYTS